MVWPCLPLLPSLAFFQFPECPEFFSTEGLCMCYSRCLDCCSLSSSNVCLLLSFQLSPQMSPPQGDLLSQLWPSVQFSRSVVSDSLWPHESQHTRPPCPSPTPGVHWDSRPSSQLCHPAISSSVIPFSSCPQSFPASESFAMSQLFAWGGQSTGVSASATFLPKNTQDQSPSEWTGWISLQSKGLSSLLQHHSSKASILQHSAFFTVQLSHPYMTTGKTIAFTRRTFVGKVMSLLLNMLSRLVITFLPTNIQKRAFANQYF